MLAVTLAACGGSSSPNKIVLDHQRCPEGLERDGALHARGRERHQRPLHRRVRVDLDATASGCREARNASTITRPDGTKQLVVGGKPLYTFAQDKPGSVTGNGAPTRSPASSSPGTPCSPAAHRGDGADAQRRWLQRRLLSAHEARRGRCRHRLQGSAPPSRGRVRPVGRREPRRRPGRHPDASAAHRGHRAPPRRRARVAVGYDSRNENGFGFRSGGGGGCRRYRRLRRPAGRPDQGRARRARGRRRERVGRRDRPDRRSARECHLDPQRPLGRPAPVSRRTRATRRASRRRTSSSSTAWATTTWRASCSRPRRAPSDTS